MRKWLSTLIHELADAIGSADVQRRCTPDEKSLLPAIPPARVQEKELLVSRAPRVSLSDDLIMSQSVSAQFDQISGAIVHRRKIYDEWNFKKVDALGAGVVANFYGPPGTGKTVAAEALAHALCMDIIHVNISDLESKFLGETSKNIAHAFALAKKNSALLFFDEADTLLGKRLSSVTQGVDNEVNAMRSTLLIELERHDGVTVFATNFPENYDHAFRSRIGHHIRFELPDEETRYQLWGRFLVPEIPLGEERGALLKSVSGISSGLSGREIRNAMRLALTAVAVQGQGTGLTLADLEQAIQRIRMTTRDVGSSPSVAGSSSTTVENARALMGIRKGVTA